MNYNLMPLKYFVDVVQTCGFNSAAKRNYVSETAVSAAISKLEGEIGHKLIDRSSGHFAVTSYGEALYKRATVLLYSYDELWHHVNRDPTKLLKVHFFQGLAGITGELARKLAPNYQLTFDQEGFANGVQRLVQGDYDVLVGFRLAFSNNAKLSYYPLRQVSLNLLFNKIELENTTPQKLAQNSTLYLQYWQTTNVADVQTGLIDQYQQAGWTFKNLEGVNSFTAAALNVNQNGGFALVPNVIPVPRSCQNLVTVSPEHLKNCFSVGAAIRSGRKALGAGIAKAIS